MQPDRLEDFSQYQTLASGIVRGVASKDIIFKEQQNKQTIGQTAIIAKDYGEAAQIWQWLQESYPDLIKDIDAIRHRVVLGGHLFALRNH